PRTCPPARRTLSAGPPLPPASPSPPSAARGRVPSRPTSPLDPEPVPPGPVARWRGAGGTSARGPTPPSHPHGLSGPRRFGGNRARGGTPRVVLSPSLRTVGSSRRREPRFPCAFFLLRPIGPRYLSALSQGTPPPRAPPVGSSRFERTPPKIEPRVRSSPR